jgi:hypothetical protein
MATLHLLGKLRYFLYTVGRNAKRCSRYIWGSLSGVQFSQPCLTTLDKFQDHAVSCCRRVWRAVRHILCDDSPEGHLPEELQQIEGLDTKDLLSYSFRAIHESRSDPHGNYESAAADPL